MNKLLLGALIVILSFSAASAVGEVQVLVLIRNPSGGTFQVIEQAMVYSQGKPVPKQTPAIEHEAGSNFQKVFAVSGSEGYIISIRAVSGRLEDVQVSVTDYSLKLTIQPRLIPGSDPPEAVFSFNATELKACCGE
jgi:hypothetical protein